MNNKTKQIWFAINKNGFIGLYEEQPVRNVETGKWESKFPFINSIVYEQITQLIEKTQMNWDSDAECITIGFEA